MSFKDFSTAQKAQNKDDSAAKPKSALDALGSAKPSDKTADKEATAAKD